MKRKRKYSAEEGCGMGGNDLTDSNEQEQEKVGIEKPSESEPRAKAPSPDLPDRRDEPRSMDLKERNPVSLPDPEERQPPLRKESEPIQPPKSEPKSKKKRGGVLWGAAMVSILLVSISVMVFAIVIGADQEALIQQPSSGDTGNGSAGEEKVIFVRQYDGSSGILSAPELYAACADTVVSIMTKNSHATGVGSGFILTADGYIGTANHVVAGMDELTVMLSNGDKYPATLVAGNELTDLALLKIDGAGLPTVTMGASGELLTGERVFAIGTPASTDYAGSLCSGVVSCAKRTVRITHEQTGVLEKKMTLIQTDAPVNPGNSGCPLFDEAGRVIGVVTMKLGNDFAGIGFAIPSDGAAQIFSAMMSGAPLTDELLATVGAMAPKLGIVGEAKERNGVYGVEILRFPAADSPAASVLKVGDLITKIDETPITSLAQVSAAIELKNPGQTVQVTVLRAGQYLTFPVTLGK